MKQVKKFNLTGKKFSLTGKKFSLTGKKVSIAGKKVISIDIGQHTTKIIAGKIHEKSIELTHAITFPTPSNSYRDGQITDFTKLENAIASKLKALKIKASKALCSIDSSEIITRESIVPLGTDEEVEKMLDYEIQQYMPIKVKDYMILSKALENEEHEHGIQKVHALVTAIPNDIVYNYYDLLKALKLKPVVFDTQSNILDKLIGSEFIINEDVSIKDMSFAVIDVGYGHINVSIFKKGKYVFSRSLMMGAKGIDINLMRHLDVSRELAEAFKFGIKDLRRDSKPDNDEQELNKDELIKNNVLNIVRSTIDNWLEGIEKVMHYYTTQSISNNIEQIYIYGGTTQINGFSQYIQQAYNIPVSHINGISNVTCDFFEGDEELMPYINALGTMIRR